MEKAYFLDKRELELIVTSLGEKIEIIEQVAQDHPEEKPFLHELEELHADLNIELKNYAS